MELLCNEPRPATRTWKLQQHRHRATFCAKLLLLQWGNTSHRWLRLSPHIHTSVFCRSLQSIADRRIVTGCPHSIGTQQLQRGKLRQSSAFLRPGETVGMETVCRVETPGNAQLFFLSAPSQPERLPFLFHAAQCTRAPAADHVRGLPGLRMR